MLYEENLPVPPILMDGLVRKERATKNEEKSGNHPLPCRAS
jgi:hypothetical protein